MYAAVASSPVVRLSRGCEIWTSSTTCRSGGPSRLSLWEFNRSVPLHASGAARRLRHGAQPSSLVDSGARKDFESEREDDPKCFFSDECGWMKKIAGTKLGKAVAPIVATIGFYLQVSGPALAEVAEVDPSDSDEAFITFLLTSGFLAVLYLFVIPAITYNYLRLRWYKRNAAETYFQFMLVFLFFPGMLLLAPFINFRRLPKEGTEPP